MHRPISLLLSLVMVIGGPFAISADTAARDRFTFARPPAPESTVDQVDQAGRMSIDITRWSTDAERDRVVATITSDGPERVLNALRDAPRLGTLHWPGGVEYGVHYARRTTRADGGTDVVLLIDRPLWLWWESNPPSTTYPFTLVQMRLGKDGRGEGHVSLGASVSSDPEAGVVLSDYAAARVAFTGVRHVRTDP
jgi:hypothetical protein